MKAALRVARALAGRRGGTLLGLMAMGFGVPLLPLLAPPPGTPMPPEVPQLLVWIGTVFSGALLGWRASLLWGGDVRRIVPGHVRVLLGVVIAVGVLLIVGPVLAAMALHAPLRSVPAARVMLVTACAHVGAGVLWGFHLPRCLPLWGRVGVVAMPLLWFNAMPGVAAPFGLPWGQVAQGWGVYQPATVLALLLGPWNWPWLLTRHRGTLLVREDRTHALVGNRLPGTALDGWLWQRLVPFIGLGRNAWGHWLVLRSAALGQLWAASLAALALLAVHRLFDLPVPMFQWTLYTACVATFVVGMPVRPGLVGRALLLPGGARRAHWPAWVARHHAVAVGLGTAVAWLPAMLAAHAAGLGWADTLLALAAAAATLGASVVWTVFSLVRRSGPQRRLVAGFAWLLATAVLVMAAASSVLLGAPGTWQAATMAAAAAWLLLLVGLARAGAPRCTLDGG